MSQIRTLKDYPLKNAGGFQRLWDSGKFIFKENSWFKNLFRYSVNDLSFTAIWMIVQQI